MADEPIPFPTQKRMTDLLMLADAPWVATVIMGVSQPFAQLRDTIGLPAYLPLIVAFVVSVLLATYWVSVQQITKPAQSLLVVPVVAMMLFSASIGANNVVKAAATGSPTASSSMPSDDQRAEILQKQNGVLHEQLDLEKRKTAILSSPGGSDPLNSSRRDEPADADFHFLSRVLPWLSSTAYAQQPAHPTPDQPQLTSEQRAKLEQLEREQKALEQKQQELEAQKTQTGGGKPLWKSW